MSEIIRIGIEGEEELDALIARMDEAIIKREQLTGIRGQVPTIPEIPRGIEPPLAAETAEISRDVDRILLEAGGLDAILFQVETTDAALLSLKDRFMEMDVPGLDRATRVLVMRVPVLREVIQLISVIKRTQWAMDLGSLRGPVTAALTLALYFSTIAQQLIDRQNKMEAKLLDLERITTQRYITMEEALRGYDYRPEKYRATVPP